MKIIISLVEIVTPSIGLAMGEFVAWIASKTAKSAQ